MDPKPRTKTPGKPGQDRSKAPADDPAAHVPADEHEGATDEQVGDTTGPGVGYDQEPEQESDEGGVGVS
jgi:hypothetical protein